MTKKIVMSKDLHLFCQLLVILGWIILLVYSYTRKRKYFCEFQVTLLILTCVGFSVLNISLFDAVPIKTDWWSGLLYISQIAGQFLFAITFHQKETNTDKVKCLEISLDIFKKVSNEATRAIWVIDYHTKIIKYSNDAYHQLYGNSDGNDLKGFWSEEILEVFFENNRKAFEANGEVLEFLEPISATEKRKFKKFYAIMDGVPSIIGMSYE